MVLINNKNIMNQNENQCFVKIKMDTLLSLYPPSEIENSLFAIFETANIHSELDQDEREKRYVIHDTLREIFRKCNDEYYSNCKNNNKCTEIK